MKTDWIAGLLGPWSAELTLGSIFLRLAVSMALAAIIGCERSSKRHSAGLRTFILVSIAGVSAMLIDQWLMAFSGVKLPVLSAAAVVGMATISGNSILFSSRNQIKGLTTSAGLWCCGLLELANVVGGDEAEAYRAAAMKLLTALNTLCADWTDGNMGILQKCTASYHNDGAGRHVNIL